MYLFMTGYPGFIATRLLRELVKRQRFDRIYLLVQDTPDRRFIEQARAAIAADLSDLPVKLVPGDITRTKLGITDEAILKDLREEAGVWWHLAAVYRLDVGEAIAQRVNVEGTRQVLALARQCPKLQRFNYVSTAFVSGDRVGRIREDELWPPERQGFKNYYESTKHAAEVLVREAMTALPVTIYRYGVVIGDSRTGETAKFDGPYFMLNFMKRWGKYLVPLVGAMRSPFNMVPVDYVVQASAALAARADTVGQTYQIVDPEPWSGRRIIRRFSELMKCRRPWLRVPKRLFFALTRIRPIRHLMGIPAEAVVYMNHNALYDGTAGRRLLEKEGVACPRVASYLPVLVDWYRKNRDRPELQVPVD